METRTLLVTLLVLCGCGSGTASTATPAVAGQTPLPAVCASLVRAPGAAAAGHSMASSGRQHMSGFITCRPAATSVDGTLALQSVNAPHDLDIVSPSGELLASYAEADSVSIFGKPNRFIARSAISAIDFVQSWDASGTQLVRRGFQGMTPVADNPTGGIVGTLGGRIVWLDDDLNFRFSAPAPLGAVVDLLVDDAGNTLVQFELDPSGLGAVWYDAFGQAGTPFSIRPLQQSLTPGQYLRFDRRAGGGFFVASTPTYGYAIPSRVPGEWVAQLDPLSTRAAPPPDWLAVRTDRRVRTIHGGTAYALLPDDIDPPDTGCTQSIEILTAEGDECGTLAFPQSVAGSCGHETLEIGIEGTVTELAPDPDPSHYTIEKAPMTCFWQWWPALLH